MMAWCEVYGVRGGVNDLFINCRLNEKADGDCPRRLNIWR